MATVKVYDQNKQESGEITLASDVFEIEVRPEILNLVARAQMAAKRAGTHMAKTRALVSGGGVKPWKQKGTGRARSGSNRSPIWRGGAIIFGPSPRDYSFKVNSKVRALAIGSVGQLAARLNRGHRLLLEVDVDQAQQAMTLVEALPHVSRVEPSPDRNGGEVPGVNGGPEPPAAFPSDGGSRMIGSVAIGR